MSTKIETLIGKKFGNLTVIEVDSKRYEDDLNRKYMGEIKSVNTYYICKCSCGRTTSVFVGSLKKGVSTSCGACNSFGKYLLDTYGNLNIWSYKNDASPFDIAYKSHKKIILICPECKKEKLIRCKDFVRRGISCTCGDGQSYPNKFVYKILDQLNIKYESEKTFSWIKTKRYDVYIPFLNLIIENHGLQHYGKGFETFGGKTLEEEQSNDKIKKELALSNGIKHYIALDCRKSELEWIKKSVMESELPKLLNFKEEDIDWVECHKYALTNMVKTVCDLWMSRKFNMIIDMAVYLKMNRGTVLKYLKQGAEIGWCDYNANEQINLNNARRGELMQNKLGKTVEVIKDGKSMGVFKSISELARISQDVIGEKLEISAISNVCNGKRSQHKGYIFKYID